MRTCLSPSSSPSPSSAQYYEMSNCLNVEMHKQAEIAKRLNAICLQIIPFLSQEVSSAEGVRGRSSACTIPPPHPTAPATGGRGTGESKECHAPRDTGSLAGVSSQSAGVSSQGVLHPVCRHHGNVSHQYPTRWQAMGCDVLIMPSSMSLLRCSSRVFAQW